MATAQDLLGQLQAQLNALPGLNVRDVRRDVQAPSRHGGPASKIDVVLALEVRGRPVQMIVEAKANGYPRDIKTASEQLLYLQRVLVQDPSALSTPVHAMVIAPTISPGGREVARSRGIGYWDETGSLYMELPGGVYYLDRPPSRAADRSPARADGQSLRNPYRGKAQQVLHALLLELDRPWHVQELAEQAGVSLSTAHNVLIFLERQLWVEKQGTGPRAVRLLREPGPLLDAWAAAHSLEGYAFHRFHRWTRTPAALRREVADILGDQGIDYALTLASGAALVAPHLSANEQLSVLIPPTADIGRIASEAALTPADTGATVVFMVSQDRSPLLFRQGVDGVFVASPVQLYLDLWAWPMRGKEQARYLRAELLRY